MVQVGGELELRCCCHVRYNWVAKTVYESIVKKGKWAWDLFLNNDPNCINCGDCPQPVRPPEEPQMDVRWLPVLKRALLVCRSG